MKNMQTKDTIIFAVCFRRLVTTREDLYSDISTDEQAVLNFKVHDVLLRLINS